MNELRSPSPSRGRRMMYGAGLLAAGTLVGGILAGTVSASAASTPSYTPSTSATGSTSSGSTTAVAPGKPGGAAPVRSDEKAVSAANLATLKAAALKAVPGGTVYRVETDAGDGTYEAHMTKADGSLVTVKFDKNLAVIKVEQGMGQGDPHNGPAGAGAPGSA